MRERSSYWPRRATAQRRTGPSNPYHDEVAARADFRCEYCKARETLFPYFFPLDHVVPRAWGGLTFVGNLALACRSCNDAKRTLLGVLDPMTALPVWLFNPRGPDPWSRHLRFDTVTGRIDGLTDVGEVTVRCLKMNHPKQLIARQLWVVGGLYP